MPFTDAHCQAPLCNPSRASVMSGTLPSTTGVYENLPTQANEPLPSYWDRQRITTMGEYFSANAYRTIGVGKIIHQCKWRETFQEYGPAATFGPTPKEKIHSGISGVWIDHGRFPEWPVPGKG